MELQEEVAVEVLIHHNLPIPTHHPIHSIQILLVLKVLVGFETVNRFNREIKSE
jgi:hypothetical protein